MKNTGSLLDKLRTAAQVGPAVSLLWESSKRRTVLTVGLVLVQAAIPLLALYVTKLVVDQVAAALESPDPGAMQTQVLVLLALAAGLTLVGAGARIWSSYVTQVQGRAVTDHVLDLIHRKSSELDLSFYEDSRFYDRLHRAQREGPTRPTQVLRNLLGATQSSATLVGILGLLISVHWILGLLLGLGVLPALMARIVHADRLDRWQEERAPMERMATYLQVLLTWGWHAREVRLFRLASTLRERFSTLRTHLREEEKDIAASRSFYELGVQAVAGAAVLGSLAFIALRTLDGVFTIGDLVMYFGAVQRAQGLLHTLFSSVGGLYEDNIFLENLEQFFELEPQLQAPADPVPIPQPVREGFRLDDVSFRYPGADAPLLRSVNLSVRPGEMMAIVGPNGSGKTTLVKLLCRLYDPSSGRILLDGTDLRRFDPADLRSQISVVLQDFSRYQLSVADNISFGNIDRSPEDEVLWNAASQAQARSLIEGLPRGMETVVGHFFDDSHEMSVGEWQKIALARALFSDAQFLILDEPTSSLDVRSEVEVFRELRKRTDRQTVIVISHRLWTVSMADRIVLLEGGAVQECGSHDELLQLGGRYAELYELQMGRDGLDETDVQSPGSWASMGTKR